MSRPLYMLDAARKLYYQVLATRLRNELEAGENLVDTQFGFRPNGSRKSALTKPDKIV